jgi:membrane associated rhomboid family serine protease
MLPIEDRAPEQPRIIPFVTYSIIALNVLVFMYELTLTEPSLDAFVGGYGATPFEITHGVDLIPKIPWPVYATLVTSLFIHGGFLHVFSNMIFFWVFGDNIERYFGHLFFGIFYLLGGVAAAFAQVAIAPNSQIPMIGASGAISAVLGSYLLLFPRATIRTVLFVGPFFAIGRVGALLLIAAWFALQLLQGIGALLAPSSTGNVAFFAHIGGFTFGVVVTVATLHFRHQHVPNLRQGVFLSRIARNWVIAIAVFAIALWLVSMLAASNPAAASTLGVVIILGAAIFATVDAVLRLTGHHSFLGDGRGIGRLLAVIQLLVALGLLLGLIGVL